MSLENQKKFGKVAVVMGGSSAEREISLLSGSAVLNALLSQDIDAIAFDPKEQDLLQLKSLKIDRVWNAMHGRGGEDGTLQAVLEFMNIPYTGSRVLGSSISMDKWRSKLIWKSLGIPVAPHILVDKTFDANQQSIRQVFAKLGPTVFVKPSHEGSSVGMSKASTEEELKNAIQLARRYDEEILVESFIAGREYTVSILRDRALPSISMVTPREFYDYEAKYNSSDTQYFCPSGLKQEEEKILADLAMKAFKALNCSGWGRVDFIRDHKDNQFKILEVNTVPGMTKSSLVPKAARQLNITFEQLTLEILKTSL